VALPPLGLARAAELLQEIAGGELVAAYDQQNVKPETHSIDLPVEKLTRLLGFGVSHKEAVAALEKLQIPAQIVTLHKAGDDAIVRVAEVPWWRPDLWETEDLVEEVVRIIGYDKVPSTIPSWRPKNIQFDRVRPVRRKVRDILWAAGAFEVMTYSFVSAEQLVGLGLDLAKHLKLKNPLSSEQAYLRSSLLPSHLSTLERNRMYSKAVRFSEISNVFVKRGQGEQPDEPLRLGVTVLAPKDGYAETKGMLDQIAQELNLALEVRPAASDVYASGRYGEVWLGREVVGGIGQLHPNRTRAMKIDGEIAHFEVDLDRLMAAAGTRAYRPRSVFPTTVRDVTFVLPRDMTWQAVKDATAAWDVTFVSDYYGAELPAGMKGMTIRLRLSLPDRTPTEAEAVELENAVLARLQRKLNVQVRA